MTIGELAEKAGVNVETVRYYERRGLLEKPSRPISGYRRYPPEAVERIRFIRHAKALGFSLKEIKELMSLRLSPETSCLDIKRKAEEKVADIRERIGRLRRMEAVLSHMVKECRGSGPVEECPILEALESDERGGEKNEED